MSHIPALPPIEGDMMLDVFTHRSIRETSPNSEYGDTDRLAELGSSVLKMAVMYSLFRKRPLLSAIELSTQQAQWLSDEQISQWLSTYSLKAKVRKSREAQDSPDDSRFLFHAYVGAAYLQRGISVVLPWICLLVDPDSEPPAVPGNESTPRSPPPYSASSSAQPVQPTVSPPPTSGPSLSGVNVLVTFNQACSQRGYSVVWQPESQGPPHDPRWIVRCIVNGEVKGSGIGRNQKAAKEEAAKEAFQRMNWAS
ncbi:hypothetical protein F5I97DRAFT_1809495 [Phlebopus sp. FC_14]|nr:hypothetical protein F5I97DRAFT_1809495 [Phlebopus sp. FC_14]